MAGFEKIELQKTTTEPMATGKKRNFFTVRNKKQLNKRIGIILGVLLLFIVLSIFFVVLPAQRAYVAAKKTYTQARLAATAMKNQNVELASEELAKTQVHLNETQKHMGSLVFLKFVPIVNWYYNDADHMLKAGDIGLESAAIVVDSLKPYADVLGLKGQGSFTMGSAEDRIKTAVLTMGKITPQIDKISSSLDEAEEEIDAINPAHYPEFIFGKKVKAQLTQMKELTSQTSSFVHEARPLIKVLPSLLGEKEEKRYLILFQNDKELRATGGFITSYSIFKLDKGVITVETQDDIYPLDDSIPNKPVAPEPILKYLPKVPRLNLRDSNLSPDYIESMKQFNELYETSSLARDIDGIIALDTHVLVSTIKILDDQVNAGGITFTTKEDERCKCPSVIYELENNISRPVNYIKTDRKGLLGSLMMSIMDKALSSSPKVYWGPLFQSMLMQVNQKHVMFYLYDKEAQSGIEALNAAGRIKAFDGDYLHVNNANMGGQKANLFTSQEAEVDYKVDKDGTITKTLKLEYNNTFPPSDCNLERGGLCLNAPLRNWIRVYVPKGSQLVSSKGSEVKVTTYEDLGKTVFDGFFTVRPLGKKTFTISYTLPFKLEDGSPLPVLIQKQPGTNGTPYKITVEGATKDEFELFADKEVELKI